jgi:hypothetical protein
MILVLAGAGATLASPVELVREQGSEFVIYHDETAPSSVAMAASELREYLYRGSGAKLAIVHQPRSPMICLGNNAASSAAGLSLEDIPVEGFRIVTRVGNIYILGPDTAEGERTSGGGTSTGTRNGTYAFIEQFLGVRWLVPGKHGDYVPKSTSITVPETDLVDAPFFLNRRVPYTQQGRREVKRWWARQRLGWSLYLNHSHNWRRTVPASHFDQHPDWFPERGGVRVPPTGRYKLCTTNPGVVRAYADATIAYFDRNPEATCYSLSPSDSAGYCECERCSALCETDPNGDLSVTPAILTFYNDVARLVAKRHPDKQLAGYVYAAYVFPPKKPIPLEPNVFLVWAPSFDYGYTLFRPELRRQWDDLLAQWTRVTENISYYDLPTHILTESGALNPPGLKILRFLYPRLKAANFKGVYVYGIEAWGRAAQLNYLLAKLAWDPDADVDALFDEFCEKAYGRGGDDINRMYRLLDAEVERHFLQYPDARYRLTPDMMRDIYAKNLTEIERLYRAAESKVEDADARARLKMIGDNLTVLHWNLRQFRLLDAPKKSSFYLSDADFFEFLSNNRESLALQPTTSTATPSYVRKKLKVALVDELSGAEPTGPFRLRGDQHLVLCPTGKQPAQVKFSRISARGKLVTHSVYRSDGTEVSSGLMSAEVPIQLPVGSPYYHLAISAGSASFMVEVTGAGWAVDGNLGDQGLHFLGTVTPVYFHVPEAAAAFHLSLEATPPGETALATLYAPDGQLAAEFDCTSVSVDRQKIAVATGNAGWWKLQVKRAPTGALDDVWIKVGDELSGYFSLAPDQALHVQPAK